MELPRRLFIAIGKDEVDSFAANDQKRQTAEEKKREAERDRDHAFEEVKQMRDKLEQAQTFAGATAFVLLLVVLAAVWLWFRS